VKRHRAVEACELLWSGFLEKKGAAPWESSAPRISRFVELLLQSAHARNLLSHSQRNNESLWWHVFDSLQAIELIEPDSEPNILDAGSGNGFPGLPLALALPDLQFSLVERSASKAEFLEFALASLAIPNARVHVHELSPQSWALLKPDLVVMRALVPSSQLSRLFAREDSASPPFEVFTTSEKATDWEIGAGSSGYGILARHSYTLPDTGARRETLKFVRT